MLWTNNLLLRLFRSKDPHVCWETVYSDVVVVIHAENIVSLQVKAVIAKFNRRKIVLVFDTQLLLAKRPLNKGSKPVQSWVGSTNICKNLLDLLWALIRTSFRPELLLHIRQKRKHAFHFVDWSLLRLKAKSFEKFGVCWELGKFFSFLSSKRASRSKVSHYLAYLGYLLAYLVLHIVNDDFGCVDRRQESCICLVWRNWLHGLLEAGEELANEAAENLVMICLFVAEIFKHFLPLHLPHKFNHLQPIESETNFAIVRPGFVGKIDLV